MDNQCEICQAGTNAGDVCPVCLKHARNTLLWLERIGMPTLQQIAYRQASMGETSPRHGNRAYAATPLDIDARQTYIDAETTLQRLAGQARTKPYGWQADGTPRTLLAWDRLIPIMAVHIERILNPRPREAMQTLADTARHVSERIERPEERRLIGICPQCHATTRTVTDPQTGETRDEPLRTPIYATERQHWAVCPYCAAFLDLAKVRASYLKPIDSLHITRKRAGAARWLSDASGRRVTGKMLDNWRQAGRLHPRRVDGQYWEWSIRELLACVR